MFKYWGPKSAQRCQTAYFLLFRSISGHYMAELFSSVLFVQKNKKKNKGYRGKQYILLLLHVFSSVSLSAFDWQQLERLAKWQHYTKGH